MPNLQMFLQLDKPEINSKPTALPQIKDIKLPRNQWYFHHQQESLDIASAQPEAGQSRDDAVSGSGVSWQTILIFFVVVDALWGIHRLVGAYSTAKLMLYGTPVFIEATDRGECVTVTPCGLG